MYSIKLDENNYFAGSFATVGKVEGGVNIPTLPPDMEKAKFYKYDYYDVATFETVPVIDKETGEFEVDELGNTIFEEKPVTHTELGWIFDEAKYQASLVEKLEDVKQVKINQLSSICETTITNGLDIETSLGTERFSLEITDQLEIMNQYSAVLKGVTHVPYHVDDILCRIFTAEEMANVAIKSTEFVTYNRTYFNYIKEAVKRCSTEEEVNSVIWGSPLPEDLDELFASITGISTITE